MVDDGKESGFAAGGSNAFDGLCFFNTWSGAKIQVDGRNLFHWPVSALDQNSLVNLRVVPWKTTLCNGIKARFQWKFKGGFPNPFQRRVYGQNIIGSSG